MTPHDLLAAFEPLAEAPDGIARLRELVLQLAVRGKLVSQDPNDEPACVLLERIAAEKARLVKGGKIPKPLPVDENEMSWEVSAGWSLVPFGDVFIDIFTGPFGTALKASEYIRGGTPLINPQNMKDGAIIPTDNTCVGLETMQRLSTFVVYERDIVVARRGEMGRCAVVSLRESGWLCGTGSLVLRPPKEIVPQYVALFLRSPETTMRLAGDSVGSTMSNLNQRILVNLPFGLPPLPEQHRIVAKVDSLMVLLDCLETARGKRKATRTALRDAALAALRDASDTESVEAAWTRIAERVDDLFTDPADIAPLRQAILQLAVRGKLVPQDPSDEPACVLLERIAAEQTRLAKEGKSQKLKPLPPMDKDEMPFEAPEGWVWARAQELTVVVTDGDHMPPPKSDSGIPFAVIGNISSGVIDLTDTRYVPLDYYKSLDWTRKPMKGDLLYTVTGSFGIVVPVDTDAQFCVQRHVGILKTSAVMANGYLRFALSSPFARDFAESVATGIAQKTVPLSGLRKLPVPLPPLPEQHRIVAKVDALMALCDALEAHLAAACEAQAAFAAAAVHHLDV